MRKYLILLLLCGFIGNSQNLYTKQIWAGRIAVTYNTYIGGVSGTITSASSLATKLGISVGNISNFSIVGSDIKCKITGSYVIPINCFNSNQDITYYKDNDGLVTSIGASGFAVNTTDNFKEAYFPNVTSVGDSGFNCSNFTFPNIDVIYIPRCTALGTSSSVNNAVFGNNFRTSIRRLYVDSSLATINSGSPDPDLTSYTSLTGNVMYVTNFTDPSAISDLSAGTIYNTAVQLTFTPPSTTNAIDYYELYINGVYTKRLISGDYATGLTENTVYNFTVYARDVFYNLSPVSNNLTQSTSNYSYTDTDANAYISAASLTGAEKESAYLLIAGLKTNSLYTKCQTIYPFKGTTSAQHKFNAKNPVDTDGAFRLTFNGTATYANNGYTPNGSTGYADSHFIPVTNQSLISNGMTVVCGTNNPAAGVDVVDIGSFNSGTQKSYVIVKNNNSTYARIVGFNSNNISITGINESRGIFTGTKQSATVTDFFINGIQVGTTSGGGTLPTLDTYVGAMNLSGSAYGYSNQRLQMVIFHEGFSDAETATLYNIIDLSETIAGRKTW